MSEFNFDKLRNLNIPDEWADKTIQKVKNKKQITIKNEFRITKLAIVVSAVLIFIFSVFTFCLPQSNEDSVYLKQTKESTCSSGKNNQSLMFQHSTKEYETIESITAKETESIPNDSYGNYDVEPTEEEQSGVSLNTPDGSSSNNSDCSVNSSSAEEETQYDEWVESYHFLNIFMLSDLKEDRKVYCKVYSDDENRFLGDPNLFSDEHLNEYEFKNDTYCIYRYYPIQLGILTKNGSYTAYYYNSDGEIFFENSFYFSRFKED